MITMSLANEKQFNASLKKLAKKHDVSLYRALVDSTVKLHKLAVNNAPIDEGTLRREIKFDITRAREFTGDVTSHANYSEAVEGGTKAHHIEIKKKKVLAGKGSGPGGWNIYGKRVQHPGTKPQPFMYPAFTVAKNFLFKQIEKLF